MGWALEPLRPYRVKIPGCKVTSAARHHLALIKARGFTVISLILQFERLHPGRLNHFFGFSVNLAVSLGLIIRLVYVVLPLA